MGTPAFESLCRSVTESLHAVSGETERVYGEMGEKFPVMVRELNRAFDPQENRTSLTRLTENLLAELQDHEAVSAAAQGRTQQFLARLEVQVAALVSLESCVAEIKEDSILMELLSLNAMVIAAKAGESGRAFSVITNELQKIASRCRNLTDEISRKKSNLDRIFGDFGQTWTDTASREYQSLSHFITPIRAVFGELQVGEARLLEGMEKIRAKAKGVKDPLVGIMVEVQNQDRIRQSIDHVISALQEVAQASEDQRLETRLDQITYLSALPDLSVQVLDEISEQISANQNSFRRSLNEATHLIVQLEEERRDFVGHHAHSAAEDSLGACLAKAVELFQIYFQESSRLMRTREGLVRMGDQLEKNVATMVETLKHFVDMSASFRNVDLASRIQVARHSALVAMRDNSASMTNLTQKIDQDVSLTMSTASDFSATMISLLENFQAQFTEGFHRTEQFIRLGQWSVDQVREAQENLIDTAENGRIFNDRFREQFNRTSLDLENLGGLLQTVADQRKRLLSLKEKIEEEKKNLLAEKGVSEWKLKKEKLKSIVDGFTIFSHKKILADLGDFEVEQAVDAGEVTLF